MKTQQQKVEALCVFLLIAAEMLGISTGLCYRLVHEGQIPSIRLGRRILVPVAALQEMLDGNREGVRPCPSGKESRQRRRHRLPLQRQAMGNRHLDDLSRWKAETAVFLQSRQECVCGVVSGKAFAESTRHDRER